MWKVENYNVALKCFLKNKKWEILILKSSILQSSFWGSYDFPGWRIDEEEFNISYSAILKREIFEETGISKVAIWKEVVGIGRHKVLWKFRNTSTEDLLIFYLFFEWILEEDEASVSISNQHDDHEWVRLDEILLEDYFASGCLEAIKMYLKK